MTPKIATGGHYPKIPALTDDVKQAIVQELLADPKVISSYAKLVNTERNVVWFEGIKELERAKAVWSLASGLCHGSPDVQILCARALGRLKDKRAVPFMLLVAEAVAVPMSGSESATIHGILQQAYANALNSILGTNVVLKKHQDPERLKQGIAVWKKALDRSSER